MRLADMKPNAWFHKFKHMSSSSRKQVDPNSICSKSPSLPLHHPQSSRPRLTLDPPTRSYGRRRRAVYRSSTSLGRRVASTSPSPGPGTEAITDKADFIPTEVDSDRESVEIEYMDAGGGLSFSPASSNSLREKVSSSTTRLVIELDEPHSTITVSAPSVPCPKLTPEVKISDKEYCKMKHRLGRMSSQPQVKRGVKLWENSPVIGRRTKSQACNRKSLLSPSPAASHSMVRFANKNLGESLAMVKSSCP